MISIAYVVADIHKSYFSSKISISLTSSHSNHFKSCRSSTTRLVNFSWSKDVKTMISIWSLLNLMSLNSLSLSINWFTDYTFCFKFRSIILSWKSLFSLGTDSLHHRILSIIYWISSTGSYSRFSQASNFLKQEIIWAADCICWFLF